LRDLVREQKEEMEEAIRVEDARASLELSQIAERSGEAAERALERIEESRRAAREAFADLLNHDNDPDDDSEPHRPE